MTMSFTKNLQYESEEEKEEYEEDGRTEHHRRDNSTRRYEERLEMYLKLKHFCKYGW